VIPVLGKSIIIARQFFGGRIFHIYQGFLSSFKVLEYEGCKVLKVIVVLDKSLSLVQTP